MVLLNSWDFLDLTLEDLKHPDRVPGEVEEEGFSASTLDQRGVWRVLTRSGKQYKNSPPPFS